MDGSREDSKERTYEPPQVEDLPTQDGPAVTAAGDSPQDQDDGGIGPEWRPSGAERSGPENL